MLGYVLGFNKNISCSLLNESWYFPSRSIFLEWIPGSCVQTRLSHPVVHRNYNTPRPLQSKHGCYEWPGTLTHLHLGQNNESERHLTCGQYWINMVCVQVLEPQNVDPSMIQMTFLDDVVHSLLKGENIGITSRRRSRSSQNNNTAHVSECRHTVHMRKTGGMALFRH